MYCRITFPDHRLCSTRVDSCGLLECMVTGAESCAYSISCGNTVFCIHYKKRDFLM